MMAERLDMADARLPSRIDHPVDAIALGWNMPRPDTLSATALYCAGTTLDYGG
jgi:hypothetical protein